MLACVATSTPSPLRLQMPADEQNQQLHKGPYTIIKELGSGLHGRVLLAYDERLQRDVAVKLPAALTVNALTTDRVNVDELEHQVTSIVHECNVMRRVQHPNVLQIDRLVSGKKGDYDYVAMVTEFTPNGDMFDLGTALYMAPEIKSRRTYRGTPVDVWSAGVVLFILVTGLPPFNEASKGDAWYDDLLDGDLEHFWASQPEEVLKQ
ncbi:Protein kinase, ATP binding site [Phytophthora cactorum]|nr:Protein kinase, ATP binding site [Phytophthora cactorum]